MPTQQFPFAEFLKQLGCNSGNLWTEIRHPNPD